jgi:hypothetical protein
VAKRSGIIEEDMGLELGLQALTVTLNFSPVTDAQARKILSDLHQAVKEHSDSFGVYTVQALLGRDCLPLRKNSATTSCESPLNEPEINP